MKTIAAVAAVALTVSALVSAPVAAAPASDVSPRALVQKSFLVYGKYTSNDTADYGNARGIGNLRVSRGPVTDATGKKVGTITTVARVVAPGGKQDSELRDTQVQVQLKGGQIFAQAVNEDPRNANAKNYQVFPVTGGTGSYASARGTLALWPQGGSYRMLFDIFVETKLKSSTFSFTSIDDTGATGNAKQGLGDVALLAGTGADDSYILIATRVGSVIDAVDMQVFTADGSLFARTIGRSKSGRPQASTFAVLGGTGSYAGYRGDLRYSADGKTITARLAPPVGGSKRLEWFEDNGRNPVTTDITGGSFLGVPGSMFTTAAAKKKAGNYIASRITYAQVGGVVPVLTMIEQEFATATIIVTGITLGTGEDGTPVWRPVVGGSGDYGGAAGQVSSVKESDRVWRKTGRIWR